MSDKQIILAGVDAYTNITHEMRCGRKPGGFEQFKLRGICVTECVQIPPDEVWIILEPDMSFKFLKDISLNGLHEVLARKEK